MAIDSQKETIMKSFIKTIFFTMYISCSAVTAHAEVTISNAWVKPTVPGQPVAGAYMTIVSDKDLDIVEVSSPVAGKAEIHSMSMQGNIMRMKKLERLQLKAGKPVELKPGGFHVMLMELNHQIKEGEIVPVSFVSQEGSSKKATVTVKAMATSPKATDSSHDEHEHHH
jgi:hypothetical protein